MGASDPCFCVLPNSGPYETLEEARTQLGDAYAEVSIRGPARHLGPCTTSPFFTPVCPDSAPAPGALCITTTAAPPVSLLTNWVLLPQRLAEHPDPEQRVFYSQWSAATQAYAEAGFSAAYYQEHVLDKLT